MRTVALLAAAVLAAVLLAITRGPSRWPVKRRVLGEELTIDALQRRLELSDAELGRVMLDWPDVMGLRYAEDVEPRLRAVEQRLSLSTAELKDLVVKAPIVLSCSYEKSMGPRLSAIQEHLQLEDAQLKAFVLGWPMVLSESYEANLEEKLGELREQMGYSSIKELGDAMGILGDAMKGATALFERLDPAERRRLVQKMTRRERERERDQSRNLRTSSLANLANRSLIRDHGLIHPLPPLWHYDVKFASLSLERREGVPLPVLTFRTRKARNTASEQVTARILERAHDFVSQGVPFVALIDFRHIRMPSRAQRQQIRSWIAHNRELLTEILQGFAFVLSNALLRWLVHKMIHSFAQPSVVVATEEAALEFFASNCTQVSCGRINKLAQRALPSPPFKVVSQSRAELRFLRRGHVS